VPSWANTIEPPVCGSDAALFQITLTTCLALLLHQRRPLSDDRVRPSRFVHNIEHSTSFTAFDSHTCTPDFNILYNISLILPACHLSAIPFRLFFVLPSSHAAVPLLPSLLFFLSHHFFITFQLQLASVGSARGSQKWLLKRILMHAF